jgi:hypothetical protein
MKENPQMVKIVFAVLAAVLLGFGLAWNATDPTWADEWLLAGSLLSALFSFHLP